MHLPLSPADSVTNILIGWELTNFHYYYGFVVYTRGAHTVSVARILSWRLCPQRRPPNLLNLLLLSTCCVMHTVVHIFYCVGEAGWRQKGVLHKLHFLIWDDTFLLAEVLQILVGGQTGLIVYIVVVLTVTVLVVQMELSPMNFDMTKPSLFFSFFRVTSHPVRTWRNVVATWWRSSTGMPLRPVRSGASVPRAQAPTCWWIAPRLCSTSMRSRTVWLLDSSGPPRRCWLQSSLLPFPFQIRTIVG